MPSERIQRRIDAFLDEADEAASAGSWESVGEKARAVLDRSGLRDRGVDLDARNPLEPRREVPV
ncbi:MAG TPA: hypothetical protein QGI71_09700, partial [Dehalococcoidia bacterium]|nr:hypothetical protein [Dehalococcoidia bacterium]